MRAATLPRPTAFAENTRTRAVAGKPNLRLASVNARVHTLVLTGELNHRSAHALEEAIDGLCEERVKGITLDLRELAHIDLTGVAVIAFRWRLCRKRGFDFALIRGSQAVQATFEQAGVADLLPFLEDHRADSHPPALAFGGGSHDGDGR